MISFTGQLINKFHVQKKMQDGAFKPLEVSFVKVNTEDTNDVFALSEAIDLWDGKRHIAKMIKQKLKDDFLGFINRRQKCYKDYFIGTFQKENFEKLEPEKIFSAIQAVKCFDDTVELAYIEVNPEFAKRNIAREVKECGRQTVLSFIDYYSPNSIMLDAINLPAKKVYESVGFTPYSTGGFMIYHGKQK